MKRGLVGLGMCVLALAGGCGERSTAPALGARKQAELSVPPPLCSTDGWCWQAPSPQGEDLAAIWGSSDNDIWAGGPTGVLMHWDGRSWSLDRLDIHITSLSGTGPSDIWAVGSDYSLEEASGVEHFDGKSWTRLSIPSRSGRPGPRAVFARAADDVWVVGNRDVADGLALHWDGHAFTQSFSGAAGNLTGVWAAGPQRAWAVSDAGEITFWDGLDWTVKRGLTATYPGFTAVLGFDAWTVYALTGDGHLFSHEYADKWTDLGSIPVLAGGAAPKYASLTSLAGSGPTDLLVTGSTYSGQGWTLVAYRFDGAWSPLPIAGTPSGNSAAAYVGGNRLWVVGSNGSMLTGDRGQLARYGNEESPGFLFTGWAAGADDAWVAADYGTLEHWDGKSWRKYVVPNTIVRGFAGTSTDLWAVVYTGEDFAHPSKLLHWDGTAWTVGTRFTSRMDFLQAFGPGDLYVSDSYGNVKHGDGITFVDMEPPPVALGASTEDFWVSPSRELWLCGYNGVVRFRVGKWEKLQSAPCNALRGTAEDDIWAVTAMGNDYGVEHFDGGAWTSLGGSGASSFFSSIWIRDPSDVYISGGDTILRWDGQTLARQSTPSTKTLFSIFGSADAAWAVGPDVALRRLAP